jgi:hypothetical protein
MPCRDNTLLANKIALLGNTEPPKSQATPVACSPINTPPIRLLYLAIQNHQSLRLLLLHAVLSTQHPWCARPRALGCACSNDQIIYACSYIMQHCTTLTPGVPVPGLRAAPEPDGLGDPLRNDIAAPKKDPERLGGPELPAALAAPLTSPLLPCRFLMLSKVVCTIRACNGLMFSNVV